MSESAGILGIGTAVPAYSSSQELALDLALQKLEPDRRQERLLRMLFQRSGIKKRHGVLPPEMYWWSRVTDESGQPHIPSTGERMQQYAEHAPGLAQTAAERALENAQVDIGSITHLVTVSCTGFNAPGVDVELIRRLGLPPTTQRVHVGYMGCHGAINGLRVLHGLTAGQQSARVLMCCVELCTLHFQHEWHDERIIGDALFADGSAALVASPNAGGDDGWSIRDTASCLLPNSGEAMAWNIGDHGFEIKLTAAVAGFIEDNLGPWLDAWLDRCGLSRLEIGTWIIHPGGPKIVDAVVAALDLPENASSTSRDVLREYGNMSSPTVLFILERERQVNAKRPCVMMAFGPGLMVEAALLV